MSARVRASQMIPKYKPPASSRRLPPAKLALFRSVVAHPPSPFAVEQLKEQQQQQQQDRSEQPQASTSRLHGPQQVVYTTAPRPFIPLTNSPTNHKLWNPPAPDAKGSRQVDKDESGRLARFASRFGGAASADSVDGSDGVARGRGQFDVEADLSFLEGVTAQSPGTALGKKDIVGAPKGQKKGKK